MNIVKKISDYLNESKDKEQKRVDKAIFKKAKDFSDSRSPTAKKKDLEQIRKEYKEAFGKDPGKMKEKAIRAAVEEYYKNKKNKKSIKPHIGKACAHCKKTLTDYDAGVKTVTKDDKKQYVHQKCAKYIKESVELMKHIDSHVKSKHEGLPYISAVKKYGKDTVHKALDAGHIERDPSFKNFLHVSDKGYKELKKKHINEAEFSKKVLTMNRKAWNNVIFGVRDAKIFNFKVEPVSTAINITGPEDVLNKIAAICKEYNYSFHWN
jgi:hypothetical protein